MSATKRKQAHFDDEIFIVGDTYYYRGTPIGQTKRKEFSLGLKEGVPQKEVLKAKKALLEGLERVGSKLGKSSFTYIQSIYLEARLEQAKNPQILSWQTYRETEIIMRMHFVPYFGRLGIDEIEQSHFAEYCRIKNKLGLNLVNHRRVINHFMRWCVAESYLKYRPELFIPKEAQKPRRPQQILTDSEIEALVKAANGPVLIYVMMYLFMGMRNMEICKLRWDEIDFDQKSLKVNPFSNRTRKSRVLPINPYVLKLLKAHRLTNASEWVFPSRVTKGQYPHVTPTGGFKNGWKKALKDAGIKRHLTPHNCRATFEKFMHKNTDFTDTQREKMAGAKIDVQKNIYVTMDANDLRGLENSVNIPGISKIIGGKLGGKEVKKAATKLVKPRKKGVIQK